jgi:hypothetical protein
MGCPSLSTTSSCCACKSLPLCMISFKSTSVKPSSWYSPAVAPSVTMQKGMHASSAAEERKMEHSS